MDAKQPISTERLHLSPLRQSDLPFLLALQGDDEVMRFVSGKGRTADEVRQFVDRALEYWKERGYGCYLVSRKSDGLPVGYAGYRPTEDQNDVEIGYVFGRESWGKGYATEVSAALLAFAFDVLKLPRVMATIDVSHRPSEHVAIKLGMTAISHGTYDGLSCKLYSITQQDWKSRAAVIKKAILFGASGFIGSHLLDGLLNDPEYGQITVVVRKTLSSAQANHPKLKMLIGNFRTLPELKAQLVGDEIFIALGTTKKHTPKQDEYYRIDHDYPVLAAKIAKENGAKSVFIVTAIGADAGSSFFYIRMKGETERDIKALNFPHTHLFQPSMIVGNRIEKRAMEKTISKVWGVLDPLFIGGLNRYKGIDGKEVAKAMLNAAKHQTEKVKTYQWREMAALNGN